MKYHVRVKFSGVKTYVYRVPSHWNVKVRAGMLAVVPANRVRDSSGTVTIVEVLKGYKEEPGINYKEIEAVLDPSDAHKAMRDALESADLADKSLQHVMHEISESYFEEKRKQEERAISARHAREMARQRLTVEQRQSIVINQMNVPKHVTDWSIVDEDVF